MAGKILGQTGLRLSPFGASLGIDRVVSPMSSYDEPPDWCDVPADVARDQWARLVGLMQGCWSVALTSWVRTSEEGQASSALGGEAGGGREAPLSASATAPDDEVHRPDWIVQVRLGPQHWDRSMLDAVDHFLWRTGQPVIDVLQLAPFDLERIKAGEPFQRLRELRDSGRVRFFSVWVDNLSDARFVVEQTPAHALTVNASRHEAGWSELFDAARQNDAGLIAGPAAVDNNPEVARRFLTDTPITAFTWPADIG